MGRAEGLLCIEWLCSPAPDAPLQRLQLQLPPGACAHDALRAAGHAELPAGWALARWERRIEPDTPLADGDRLALLRPLQVEPMEARRRRHAQQRPVHRSRHRR